ncbi:MAG: hypothetical protein JWO67_5298 [Streptosporangiaceae bacterium]|nr:hypothetical protein [Streptosporangiaceae bacterium]
MYGLLAGPFSLAGAGRAPDDGGPLWVCWPKESSGAPTDLTEIGAAIEATGSGLAFVRRLRDR